MRMEVSFARSKPTVTLKKSRGKGMMSVVGTAPFPVDADKDAKVALAGWIAQAQKLGRDERLLPFVA